MNTPNNRRRKETLDKIEKAFIELIQNRDLDQISITELCKKAGVNRTTFYANYDGIHSIADSIRTKLEENMNTIYHDEITKGYNSNDFLKLFKDIKDNQIFYRTYFKLGYDNQYRIFKYDRALASLFFKDKYVEYHMEFFKAGISRMIKIWLDNGCRESPEEMAEILRSEYQGRV